MIIINAYRFDIPIKRHALYWVVELIIIMVEHFLQKY